MKLRGELGKRLEKIASSKAFKLFDESPLWGKAAFWAVTPGSTYVLATYGLIKYLVPRDEKPADYEGDERINPERII